MESITPSAFSLPNVRRFIAFRAFFNARFYYPVFTILFLDYGLTIEQFSLLNTVWAFTIVLAEVPSGALADLIGRKRLLVTTCWLMICEMLLLGFVPLGSSSLVFSAFLVNRILSGLAEALASGADEALAYDTLMADGNPDDWPRVLDIQMRVQNIAYMVTMTLGAMVYAPDTVNRFLDWCGFQADLSQQMTMRFPVYLTLVLGILALITTLGMKDSAVHDKVEEAYQGIWGRVQEVSRLTWTAGAWIVNVPMALAVILLGMSFDHVLRMVITMTSQYYRLIGLPEASFGLIGSGVALLGLVVPGIAREMVTRFKPVCNLILLFGLSLASLLGLTAFIPYLGVVPMAMVFAAMMLTSFFTSHYLNKITSSHQRATVLSFKGLAFNGAYGMIGILYAGLITGLRHEVQGANLQWSPAMIGDEAFRRSITWFPWYLSGILLLVCVICLIRFRSTGEYPTKNLTEGKK